MVCPETDIFPLCRWRYGLRAGEVRTNRAGLDSFQFLEQRDLLSLRPDKSGIQGHPRCYARLGREDGAGDDQVFRGSGRIVYFKRDTDFCALLAFGFNLVDHADLRRVGKFQGGPAGVKDSDSGIALTFKCGLFGEPKYVAVERNGRVEVFDFNDEPQLAYGGVCSVICVHARTLRPDINVRGKARMRIGELSAVSGVSVRSLRYYEEQGLLSAKRTASGQRIYGQDASERVGLIQDLFNAGLCSATMVDLLPCMSDPAVRTPKLRVRLLEERDRITTTIANLTATQTALDQLISEISSG